MTPIEYRVDHALMQALRCVEFRLPTNPLLQNPGYVNALALRYGLVGAAATHQLLVSADDSEVGPIQHASREWHRLVAGHVTVHLGHRIPSGRRPVDADQIGDLSGQALRAYLAVYHRDSALDECLDEAAKVYSARHHTEITKGWPWYRARRARNVFSTTTAESIRFASLFFDRRSANLEEVGEIALLGE